jgi:hypothetical protein
MSAQTILEEAAETTGWNADSMLALACEYIDNQKSEDAFADFIKEKVSQEKEME